jgi:hypothetical protein
MSPAARELFMVEMAPILIAAVPRVVVPVGAEDADEFVQDALRVTPSAIAQCRQTIARRAREFWGDEVLADAQMLGHLGGTRQRVEFRQQLCALAGRDRPPFRWVQRRAAELEIARRSAVAICVELSHLLGPTGVSSEPRRGRTSRPGRGGAGLF